MGGRKRNTMLGDACEALIAAVYLDSNLEIARNLILFLWAEILEAPTSMIDAKSELQEWTQSRGLGLPEYEIIAKEGPDHNPLFTVKVTVNNHEEVIAQGKSRRQGESEAALMFLHNLKKNIQK
jgi:ribonuclease-3